MKKEYYLYVGGQKSKSVRLYAKSTGGKENIKSI